MKLILLPVTSRKQGDVFLATLVSAASGEKMLPPRNFIEEPAVKNRHFTDATTRKQQPKEKMKLLYFTFVVELLVPVEPGW